MVPFRLTYQGGLRCEAVHLPSSTRLITDAPVDNHGRGESFSPTDCVATGLATCMMTIMGIVAARHAWAVEGTVMDVEKHMTKDLPRRIARIVVRFTFPAGLGAEARTVLERAAHTCPVALSLHPDVVQEVTFTVAAEAASIG